MKGHSWKDKLAWVGLVWEIIEQTDEDCRVKVRVPDGLVSFGDGETLEDALRHGAAGQSIDWNSVGRKMTEAAWASIAHC